jgi:sugar (pentulose or hexulose) kinase
MGAVCVLDIGKTNVKVALFDAAGAMVGQRSAANRAQPGPPYAHADVAAIWRFFLKALTELNRVQPIAAIVTTTHGATGAFVTADPDAKEGLALPVLDYEDPCVEVIEPRYAALRPPFAATLSPPLAAGLNLGRQIAWQAALFPEAVAGAAGYLAYPQYWAWRLSGATVSEVTSLACHTDLWKPECGRFSTLPAALGLADKFPPLARAFDAIGPLRPALAAATGLDPQTRILAGIHDSNASLVPHLLTRQSPFTLISTGTWVVLMGVGAATAGLDPAADMMANVDATGRPVACAKFMGGREFAVLTEGHATEAGEADVAEVIAAGALALPSFADMGGPFPGRAGAIRGVLPDRPGARAALANLYGALMTDHLLTRLGADRGPLVVEGGFAASPAFAAILAALRPGQAVETAGAAGTADGAALLANWPRPRPLASTPAASWRLDGLPAYRRQWQALTGI